MARSRFVCLALLACLVSRQPAFAETVLLDFTSDTCPPCVEMMPVVRQMAAEGYHVRQVNVSRDHASAARFQVSVTPTFVVMVDGREAARLQGKTSYDQLVAMMHEATRRAQASRPTVRGQSPNVITPIVGPTMDSKGRDGGAFAAGPAPGRMVDIRQSTGVRSPTVREDQGAPLSPDAAHLVAASVRLSIEDPDGRSTGSGVVVDSRGGEALVLTCGHLFRSSAGKGQIEISLFDVTSAGAQVRETAQGVLMHYDLERDLALVRFKPASSPAVAPVAPRGAPLAPGAAVTSVGCNHGDNPTAWSTRITAINRYQGFPNIEAGKAPVEGRSGGGLFNEQGQLIGICFAADPTGNEGLYASLTSIQAKLDELALSMIYQSPSQGAQLADAAQRDADQLATAAPDQDFSVRGQDPAAAASPGQIADWPLPSRASAPPSGPGPSAADPDALAGLSTHERAALEEITRRGADAEVICIIRPLTAEGRSDVIKLTKVSPAFIRALQSAAGSSSAQGPPSGAAAPLAAAPGLPRR